MYDLFELSQIVIERHTIVATQLSVHHHKILLPHIPEGEPLGGDQRQKYGG